MLLVSVAEMVDINQGAIAGYLTIAVRNRRSITPTTFATHIVSCAQYLISPLMAVVCSLGLSVVTSAAGRIS